MSESTRDLSSKKIQSNITQASYSPEYTLHQHSKFRVQSSLSLITKPAGSAVANYNIFVFNPPDTNRHQPCVCLRHQIKFYLPNLPTYLQYLYHFVPFYNKPVQSIGLTEPNT